MRIFIYNLMLLCVLSCTNNSPDQSNSETNNYNSSNKTGQNDGRNPPEQLNNETNVDDDAATFIKLAGSSAVFEIEMGKLVSQNSNNQRIVSFGEMIVKDHTKANAELNALAANKNVLITYSLKPGQKENLASLKKLKGEAFDRRYMQMMNSMHMSDIKLYNSGADNRDKAVNDFANKTLPMLNMHMDSVKAIQASLK